MLMILKNSKICLQQKKLLFPQRKISNVVQILLRLYPSLTEQQIWHHILYEKYSHEANVAHGALNDPAFFEFYAELNNQNPANKIDTFQKIKLYSTIFATLALIIQNLTQKNIWKNICMISAYMKMLNS